MPSPVTTSGFQIQQMPGIQYMDPRLFRPAYGDIIPSIQQGAQAGSNLLNIYDQARERPIRQELQQIALDEARANAISAPEDRALKRKLALLNIQNNRRNDVIGTTEVPRGIETVPNPLYDPNDPSKGPQVWSMAPAGDGPVDIYEKIRTTDPLTGESTNGLGKLVANAEDQQRAQYMAENYDSLAFSREAAAAANKVKAEAAMVKAQATAQQLENNPAISYVDENNDDGRTYRHYFPKGQPQAELYVFDRGPTKAATLFNFGGTVNTGKQQTGPVANAGQGASTPDWNSMDKSIVRLAAGYSKDGTIPIIDPAPVVKPIPSTRVFATEAEAADARATGQIAVGDKIIVGGVPGTWQD